MKLKSYQSLAVVLSTVAIGVPSHPTFAQEGEVVELDEYQVRGFRDSLQLSREEARQSLSLKDVIAADSVGKLPDANIAEALNRITSVYMAPDQGEGRYVSIRGVDPILNNVTLNGQTIAVSDTDGRSGRAAPLDVLSASSISRIEVFKVTTPDMDGQSIGGTVNIKTPSAFDFADAFGFVNAEYGYNDFGTENDIYSFQANWADRFGDNDEWGLFIGANYSYREYLSHLYENPRAGNPENAFMDELVPDRVRFGSAVGDRERYGFTANLEFSPSDESFFWFRSYFTQFDDTEFRPEYTIRNRGDIGATAADEIYWTRYAIENETRLEVQERPVYQFVFGGEQQISDAWSIEGNLNFTKAKEENPLLNYYEVETRTDTGDIDDPVNNPVSFSINSAGFATPTFNPALSDGLSPYDLAFHQVSRLRNITSEVEEETVTADFDALWEGYWGEKAVSFKTGVKLLSRDKFVDDTDLRFPYEGSDTLADAGLGRLFEDIGRGESYRIVPVGNLWIPDPDAYEAHRSANPGDYSFDEGGSTSNSIEDDYTLTEEINAFYAMATYEYSPELMFTGGVRIEETDVEVSAFSFISQIETELPPEESRIDELPFEESEAVEINDRNSYTSVLPSINMRWMIDANLLFRASISTNIGRPDYPDVSPISTLEISEDPLEPGTFFANNEIGNPDLEPYEGTNFDVSLDYYFNENSGVFSVGGFYKRIDNAIYEFEEEFDNFEFAGVVFEEYRSSTFSNAEAGHISGIEFTYQQDLTMLREPLDGLGILANVAFIDSEVEVFQRPGEKLPFFNQADLIYNIQLYYEKNGFQARLAYTYQSEVIFDELAGNPENDIYRDELESLDAKISYQFNDNWEVYLTAKNLTDEPLLTYRNQNRRFIAENPGYELYGTEFRLGLTWTK